MKLVDGLSISEISRQTGRDRGTISELLRADDSQALREQLETEGRETALQILRGNNEKAARAWMTAMGRAAEAGNHKPAKDLLLHNGVIQDRPTNHGVVVVVGNVNQPAGYDPFDALGPRQVLNVTPSKGGES